MRKKLLSNTNIIIVLVALFTLWLMLFDRNSYIGLKAVDRQIVELEEERDFYREKIISDSTVLSRLGDSAFVEQYARETFLMTREGEELYIIK